MKKNILSFSKGSHGKGKDTVGIILLLWNLPRPPSTVEYTIYMFFAKDLCVLTNKADIYEFDPRYPKLQIYDYESELSTGLALSWSEGNRGEFLMNAP